MSTVAAPGASFVKPFDGSRLINDGQALSQAIKSGNWLDGGIAFLDTLGDGAAALTDPIGTLTSIGLGWVLEHLKPLSTWMEQLTGSESNVANVARQWTSTGAKLRETGATLTSRLRDLDGMAGGTVAAYVRFADDAARHLGASGEWAEAAANGLSSASALVTKMQGVVKSAISQVVTVAIEAMAVVAASFGLGMGYAIARVVQKVNQMVNQVVRPVKQVLTSVKSLSTMVTQVRSLFSGTEQKMSVALQNSPQAISIGSGAVVDASSATAFGNSAHSILLESGKVADAHDHSNSAVLDIARTDTTIIDGLAPGGGGSGGATLVTGPNGGLGIGDYTPPAGIAGSVVSPTADGSVSGVSSLGAAGSLSGAGGIGSAGGLGSAGGASFGVGGAGSLGTAGALGAGSGLAALHLARGARGLGSGAAGSMIGTGLAGGAGLAGGSATGGGAMSAGAGAGMRPMIPTNPIAAMPGGARSGLGVRRRRLEVVIEHFDDEDEDA